MTILTDDERCFVNHRYHETIEGVIGPATRWLVTHSILPHEFLPFFYAQKEEQKVSATVPAKPKQFVIPWEDKHAFQKRVEVIKADQRIDLCS